MSTGTGFVNYQQLMDLNKDQADEYAQRVYNQLNGQGQQAQNEVAAANNYDPYVTRTYQSQVPTSQGHTYYGQKSVSEPLYTPGATSNAVDAYGNVLGSGQAKIITGPGSQTANPSAQPTGAAVNQFESSFGQAADPSALGSYLRQQKDPGSYTNGMASLDAQLIAPRVNTADLSNRYSSLMDQWAAAQQGMSSRLNATPADFNVTAPRTVYANHPTFKGDTQQHDISNTHTAAGAPDNAPSVLDNWYRANRFGAKNPGTPKKSGQ